MPFEIAIPENGAEVGQKLVQIGIEIINFVEDECIFIAGVIRFVFLGGELKLHPFTLVLIDLLLQYLLLFCECCDFYDLVLVYIELTIDKVLQFEFFIYDKFAANDALDLAPILWIFLDYTAA